MIINNQNVIESLYQINNNISKSNIIVIRFKAKSKQQQLILLGKIYCQGFELIGLRKSKRHAFFWIKKVKEPKLFREKQYGFFSKLFTYPYCEYLTPDVLWDVSKKTNIEAKEKYTFLGRLFNIYI